MLYQNKKTFLSYLNIIYNNNKTVIYINLYYQ